jgi:hypothetical protein
MHFFPNQVQTKRRIITGNSAGRSNGFTLRFSRFQGKITAKNKFFNTFIEILEFLFNFAPFILAPLHLPLFTAGKSGDASQRQRLVKRQWVDTT